MSAANPHRIYVASSWRNVMQPNIVTALRADGHQVYDFKNPGNGINGFTWAEIGLDPMTCTAMEYREAITTHPRAAQGFVADFRAMEWADTCVLVLPSGRSAHVEAGFMAGRGKRTLVLTRDGEEPELMYLCFQNICTSVQELRVRLANS
jgi:hypothetical protein